MEHTTDVSPKTAGPGWPEMIASNQFDLTSPLGGAFLVCLSGVAGLAGFAATAALRRRSWQSFGVRRTTARWLWLGVAGGVVALLAKGLLTPLFVALTDVPTDTQAGYAAGASSGRGSWY